ncbi:MAG TPA: GtrA family protein [Rubrobacteraceae bacterium]|nr:GtrA family protein [Rubrobacteraceae bacterium]
MRLPYVSPKLERTLLFLVGGCSAAILNLILAYIGVDLLGLSSDLQQNYVNLVAMEISLVYSFFIYRTFVWRIKTWEANQIFFRQLPLYHLSAGTGFLVRTLLFPLLQLMGVHYLLNIALGIVAGAAANYVLTDNFVFKDSTNRKTI